MQVKASLRRIWSKSPTGEYEHSYQAKSPVLKLKGKGKDYDENFHIENKPQEIVELYKKVDRYCMELSPDNIEKSYLKKYIKYSCTKNIFCCVHLQKNGLRIWLKLNYPTLVNPPDFARDVSKVGHWGVGDVELMVSSITRFEIVKDVIKQSFDQNCRLEAKFKGEY
jgi:predicted transport protein